MTLETKYRNTLTVEIIPPMWEWINEQVENVRKAEGRWPKYNRSMFIREMIEKEMEKGEK